MVCGLLKENSFDSVIEDFKAKYTLVKKDNYPISNESVVGYAQMLKTDDIDVWKFQSADGVFVFLIKDVTNMVMKSDATGTQQFGPYNNYGFLYIPKDRLEEIQNVIKNGVEVETKSENDKQSEEIKADKSKLQ
jgi:hypothetical protein